MNTLNDSKPVVRGADKIAARLAMAANPAPVHDHSVTDPDCPKCQGRKIIDLGEHGGRECTACKGTGKAGA